MKKLTLTGVLLTAMLLANPLIAQTTDTAKNTSKAKGKKSSSANKRSTQSGSTTTKTDKVSEMPNAPLGTDMNIRKAINKSPKSKSKKPKSTSQQGAAQAKPTKQD